MIDDRWRVVAHTSDIVGEGPVWVASENTLYWVDVLGPAINRLGPDSSLQRWSTPEPTGFIVPRRSQRGFVVGLKTGFFALQLEPWQMKSLANPEPDTRNHRLNDGKVDALGRLWAGTMPMNGDTPTGSLYRLDDDHRLHVIDRGYCVPNGPAFNLAGNVAYHADSPRKVIYRLELDDRGMIQRKKPFILFENDWGIPDGMTVDCEDHLWVAHWDGHRLSRFDPDGHLDRAYSLPVSRVTSCTFGGPALRDLRILGTSGRAVRRSSVRD